jgi:hypothetical protein
MGNPPGEDAYLRQDVGVGPHIAAIAALVGVASLARLDLAARAVGTPARRSSLRSVIETPAHDLRRATHPHDLPGLYTARNDDLVAPCIRRVEDRPERVVDRDLLVRLAVVPDQDPLLGGSRKYTAGMIRCPALFSSRSH